MLALFLWIVSLSATSVAAPVAAVCDKALLRSITDSYVSAQTEGKPAALTATASGFAYFENDKTADITKGILASALKIDHKRSQHDTTNCSTYTELIITDSKHPYVIGTQMHLTEGQVSKVETIITDKGDWLFNATGTLSWAAKETWDPIPEAKRDTRAVIQAAADAYCDIFHDKSVKVPWGQPCARLEGGSYTGKGQSSDRCDVGIPNGVELTNRRYVIDEEYGTVDVFMSFAGIPDTHEFRVEGGKLRYVHTMTVTGK
ncbi:uncharacterized protein BDR25DRAFT_387259 [Lindgomyces ingoldianus]|uniref:Uncharacterized protein n=1 Tax=Lindgomyces ingoldianus TaxID=673940 RepID=A0ACB6R1J4_9PLEO|nr:uncharacterized protein BDR25DRAFT_387259 [Lindgomyces ingoldianus]KAF2473129.1 hypothetical protein BDR25DRAFT_387259 [Lindgomyces ingoldianus]